MKYKTKILIGVGLVCILFIGTTSSVFAAKQANKNNYVDLNQDSICDNIGNSHHYSDENQDGICDNEEKYSSNQLRRNGIDDEEMRDCNVRIQKRQRHSRHHKK